MESKIEEDVFQRVIKEAWENEKFKKELIANPISVIEKLTGKMINLPEDKTLVVRDQTMEEIVFINITTPSSAQDDVELSEIQLEKVAGGCIRDPFDDIKSNNPLKGIR